MKGTITCTLVVILTIWLVGCGYDKVELIKMKYKYEHAYIWKDVEGIEHEAIDTRFSSRLFTLEEQKNRRKDG